MKCDLDWLLQWVPKAPDAETIAQLLTLAGVEAELQEDRTLELDLTPNRGDCLSMLGLARELSVLTEAKFDDRLEGGTAVVSNQTPPSLGSVEPEGCSYYSLRLIEAYDSQAVTPSWMQDRLQRCGIQPHDFLVDVTNYVMLELGQPLHAFDADSLSGPISVRWARKEEKLRALDGSMLPLGPDILVIASGNSPVAVAGVIGGANTAVTEKTQRIMLESAHFLPSAIAGRARRLKLHTEASRRFERGVDPHIAHRAMQRATQLIVEHAGGQVSEISSHGYLAPEYWAEPVFLRAEQLERCLGLMVNEGVVTRILRSLGCVVTVRATDWEVHPPSWRFDLEIEQDLVEEVVRVYGYDRIPSARLPAPVTTRGSPSALTRRIEQCGTRLVERGYCEAVTYSFSEEKLEQIFAPSAKPWRLLNPISDDYAVMRTTLSGSLLRAVQHNHNRQQSSVRLFEMARVFGREGKEVSESWILSGVAQGAAYPLQWSAAPRAIDFYDIKGDLECLLQGSGQLRFESATHPALHPGQTARIILEEKAVGLVGALHPKWLPEFDLPHSPVLFELAFSEWEDAARPAFCAWSEYPTVERDISLILAEEVQAAQLEACIRELGIEELVEIVVFDVYRARGLGNRRKSIGLHLKFQSFSGTLTDPDVDALLERVTESLTQGLGARLR